MSEGIPARRALALLAARAMFPAVTIVIYGIVGRMGADGELGLFYFAYNFLTVFQVLANFGFDSFLVREVAQAPGRTRSLLANSIVLLLPYGILLAVAMPLSARAWGLHEAAASALWLGAPALPAMALGYAFEAILIEQRRFGVILAGATLESAARLSLSLLAISADGGPGALLLALAASRTLAVLLQLAFLGRRPGIWPLAVDLGVLRELLRGARPFLAMYVAYAIATRMDGLLLGKHATPEEGDAYSIPNRLTLAIWLLSGSVVGSMYPAMARAARTPRLGEMVARTARLFFLAGVPAAALVSAYPEPAVALVGGRELAAEGARLLSPLVWLWLPLLVNEPLLRGLLATGGQRLAVRNALALLASSFVVLSLAVRARGAWGVACAMPALLAVDVLLNAQALGKFTSLRPLRSALGRPAAAALLSLPLLPLLRPSLGYGAAPAFLGAYVLALLLTGSVTWRELREPRRLLGPA